MIKVLKLAGRGIKIVSMAVGAGGFLGGVLDANTALIIVGACNILGDGIVFAGDWADDGKINQSFSIDQ